MNNKNMVKGNRGNFNECANGFILSLFELDSESGCWHASKFLEQGLKGKKKKKIKKKKDKKKNHLYSWSWIR